MDEQLDIHRLLAERVWLKRLAVALLQDDASAEDAVQDTYIAALRRPPAGLRSPRAWLGTILRNRIRNEARTRRRRRDRERRAASRERVESPEEALARAELTEQVARIVLALDEPYRTTVVLRYMEELPARVIGQRMAVPLDTVRTRLRRALRVLRARLEVAWDGDGRSWQTALAPLVSTRLPAGLSGPLLGTGVTVMGTGEKWAIVALVAVVLAVIGLVVAPGSDAPREANLGRTDAPPPSAPHPNPSNTANALRHENATKDSPSLAGLGHASQDEDDTARAPRSAADDPRPSKCKLSVKVLRGRDPVAGVQVEVVPQGEGRAMGWLGETDADGACLVADLPIGRCAVTVRLSDRTCWSSRVRTMPGPPGMVLVRVPPDATLLEGRVRAADDGHGVSGATVTVRTPARPGRAHFETVVRTGRDGSYGVEVPRGGVNGFEVRAGGFAPWPHRDDRRTVLQTLRGLSGVGPVRRDVALVRGGGLRGMVQTEEGLPLEGIVLRFKMVLGPYTDEVTTDARGEYRIDHVNRGTYDLVLAAEKWFVAAGQVTRVEVSPGATQVLDIVLARGRRFEGTVRRTDGQPAAEASVWIVVNGMSRADLRAVTDERGRWFIDDVFTHADHVDVRAASDGLQAQPVPVRWDDPVPGPIHLRLEPGCTVRGKVIDIRTGEGVDGARVLFTPVQRDGRATRSLRTRPDGTFAVRGLLPGRWDATPDAEGYHRAGPRRIEAARGVPAEVALRLDPGVVFAGVVLDEQGRPVHRATVSVVTSCAGEPDRQETRRARTGPDGMFRLSRITQGTHVLRATLGRFHSERIERRDGDDRVELILLHGLR